MKALIIATALLVPVAAQAQVYPDIGNTVYDFNRGTTYVPSGGTLFGSNGTSYRQQGDLVTGSDGSQWSRSGNFTNTPQGTWTHSGNASFGPNGTTCVRSGASTFCY